MIRFSKRFVFAMAACFMMAGVSCAKEVTVCVGAGKHWKEKSNPQIAVWLENTDGTYIRTLYVTQRAQKKSWLFGPKEGRPESLPVWYHAAQLDSAKDSSVCGTDGKALDAVSSATPKGGFTCTVSVPEDDSYVIKAECNNSFDYNEFYTKKNSGVNGQPSVVYRAMIPPSFHGEMSLSLAGTGDGAGNDGKIHEDVSRLTTARNIVQCISVTVE